MTLKNSGVVWYGSLSNSSHSHVGNTVLLLKRASTLTTAPTLHYIMQCKCYFNLVQNTKAKAIKTICSELINCDN